MKSKAQASETVVLREIREVRREIDELRTILAQVDRDDDEDLVRLNVSFDRRKGDRLPYSVSIGGSKSVNLPLSPLRAAILLVGLLDLERRSEGRPGFDTLSEKVEEACTALGHSVSNGTSLAESVRVGLYRASRFFADSTAVEGCPELLIEPQTGRCLVRSGSAILEPRRVRVRIITADKSVSSLIDSLSTSSPLRRVRREGAMYVPPGAEGYDQLLLELFSSGQELHECLMFYRLSIQSHPVELLEKYGATSQRIERTRVAVEGYRTGRIKFREILNRDVIAALLQAEPDRTMLSSFGQTFEERCGIVEHLINLLMQYPSYELVLTDAFFPFHISTLSLREGAASEDFVLFFRRDSQEATTHVGGFVLNDPATYRAINERITAWVLEHPTTVVDRVAVIRELREFIHNARRGY